MFPILNPQDTALLVIDMQYDYCSAEGKLALHMNYSMNDIGTMISQLSAFISFIRDQGILVIFIRMIEDPEYMLKNAAAKITSFANPSILCVPQTKGFEYFGVAPQTEDVQIIKNSYDAFVTKESYEILKNKGIETPLLENVLKAHQIKSLIFSGVLTSRCVDSTLRSAYHRGYTCIVPEDLVAVPDQLMFEHEAALNVWRILFAYNTTSSEIRL